jgi:hypothetical protein
VLSTSVSYNSSSDFERQIWITCNMPKILRSAERGAGPALRTFSNGSRFHQQPNCAVHFGANRSCQTAILGWLPRPCSRTRMRPPSRQTRASDQLKDSSGQIRPRANSYLKYRPALGFSGCARKRPEISASCMEVAAAYHRGAWSHFVSKLAEADSGRRDFVLSKAQSALSQLTWWNS